jgi:RimJ/RimL family protein N-acetyltransferase
MSLPIKLLPYQPSFLGPFMEWRNQPLSLRHNPLKAMSADDIARMLESEGADLEDLGKFAAYRWFIDLGNEDNEVVGTVSLKNISHSMNYAEIGYGVAEAHHGKGIATSAVKLLVEKAFSGTALRKLMALVHVENRPSCRVLEKLGFRREGLLREHYIIADQPVDEVLYGLLKHEWNPR